MGCSIVLMNETYDLFPASYDFKDILKRVHSFRLEEGDWRSAYVIY